MDERYREPENFKWEILGNTVFEDYPMFYEPFAEARTIFPDLGDAERATLTEQALRELYGSGLIFLFRAKGEVNASSEDQALRIPADEVDRLLSDDAWRSWPFDHEDAWQVWIGPTRLGEEACANPPPHIRELWNLLLE